MVLKIKKVNFIYHVIEKKWCLIIFKYIKIEQNLRQGKIFLIPASKWIDPSVRAHSDSN